MKFEVHTMCIGKSDCQFVVIKDEDRNIKSLIMIDAGRSGDATKILNYMRTSFSGEELDALIVTHWDTDHWQGLTNEDLFSQIFPQPPSLPSKTKVYYPDRFVNKIGENVSKPLSDLVEKLEKLQNRNQDYKFLKLYAGGGCEVYLSFITHKPGEKSLNKWNDESVRFTSPKNQSSIGTLFVVVENEKMKSGKRHFTYFTAGDLPKTEENALMDGSSFYVDAMKISHHGSKTSSDEKFIKYLQPKTCIITGTNTSVKSKHPHPDVLEILKNTLSDDYIFVADMADGYPKRSILTYDFSSQTLIRESIQIATHTKPAEKESEKDMDDEKESVDLSKRRRVMGEVIDIQTHRSSTEIKPAIKIGLQGKKNSEINSEFSRLLLKDCGLELRLEESLNKKTYSLIKDGINYFELLGFGLKDFKIIEEVQNDRKLLRYVSGGFSFRNIESNIEGYMLNNSMGFVLSPKKMSFNNLLEYFELNLEIPKLGDITLSSLSFDFMIDSKNKIKLNNIGADFTYRFTDGLDLSCNFLYYKDICAWDIGVNLHSNLSVYTVLEKLGVDEKYLNKIEFIKDLVIQDFGIDFIGDIRKIHMSLDYSNNSQDSVNLVDNVEMIFREGIELDIEYSDGGGVIFSLNINAGIKISSSAKGYTETIVQCEYNTKDGLKFDFDVTDIIVDIGDFELEDLQSSMGGSNGALEVGHAKIHYSNSTLLQFNNVKMPFQVMGNELNIVSFSLLKIDRAWEFSSKVEMAGFTIDVVIGKGKFSLGLNDISFYHLTDFIYQSDCMKDSGFSFNIEKLTIEINKNEGSFEALCELPEISLYGGNFRFINTSLSLKKANGDIKFILSCGDAIKYKEGIIISKEVFGIEEDISIITQIKIGSRGIEFEATYNGQITNKALELVILKPGINFTFSTGVGVGVGLNGNIKAGDFVGNALIYCNDITKPMPLVAFNFNELSIKKMLSTYIFTEGKYDWSAIPEISFKRHVLKNNVDEVSADSTNLNYLLSVIDERADDKIVCELVFDENDKSSKYFVEKKLYKMYEHRAKTVYEFNHFYFNSNPISQIVFGVEYDTGIALTTCIELFGVGLFVKFESIINQNLILRVDLDRPLKIFNDQLVISASSNSDKKLLSEPGKVPEGPYLNFKVTKSDFNFLISGRISLFSTLNADLFISIIDNKYKFHAELQLLGVLNAILHIEADYSNFAKSQQLVRLSVETSSFLPLIQSAREEVRKKIDEAAGDDVKDIQNLKNSISEYIMDIKEIESQIDGLRKKIADLNKQEFSWYEVWEIANREAEILLNYGLIGKSKIKIVAIEAFMATAMGLLEIAELAVKARASVLGMLTDSIFNILEMVAQSIEYIFKLNSLKFSRTLLPASNDSGGINSFDFFIDCELLGRPGSLKGSVDLEKGIETFKSEMNKQISSIFSGTKDKPRLLGKSSGISQDQIQISSENLMCYKDEMINSIKLFRTNRRKQFNPDSSKIISSLEHLKGCPNFYLDSKTESIKMNSLEELSNLDGQVSIIEEDIITLTDNKDELEKIVSDVQTAISKYEKEQDEPESFIGSAANKREARRLKKEVLKKATQFFKNHDSNRTLLNEFASTHNNFKTTNKSVNKTRSAALQWQGNLDEEPKDQKSQLTELEKYYSELVEKEKNENINPVLLASVALAVGGRYKESESSNKKMKSKAYFKKALKHYSEVYNKGTEQYKEFARNAK